MKKALLFSLIAVLVVVLVVGIFSTNAKALTESYYTYTVTDGEATITKVNTTISGDITIPSTLGGYPVTVVGQNAFDYCTSITSLVIPDSVTSIGDSAFYDCSSLTSIEIPNSVTSIGNYAFYGCNNLTSVEIPNSVTKIGYGVFRNCNSLTSIKLPFVGASRTANNGYDQVFGYIFGYTVTSSGSSVSGAIYQCNGNRGYYHYYIPTSLKNVIITDVANIPERAFYNCYFLTSIEIPDSVTSIGAWAFYCCSRLTSIDIPNSVTSIGYGTFEYCSRLTSIEIPNSMTSIGSHTFYECTELTSINIPDSVTSIGNAAFSGTLWLKNQPDGIVYAGKVVYTYKGTHPETVVIKDGTLGIAECAFYSDQITSITIPNSITNIGSSAFWGCYDLETVYYNGTESDWKKITIDVDNPPLLNAELITKKDPIEEAIDGTVLTTGVVGEETVIVVPTSNSVAMTEAELAEMLGDDITIVSNNGIIGTGSKLIIGEQEVEIAVKGDIDGDGVATVFDAMMVKKALANNGFENEALREFAADVDSTPGTASSDVTSLLAKIVGKN